MKFYLLYLTLIIMALGHSTSALSQIVSQKQIDSITNPPLNNIKDLLFEKNIVDLGELKENQDPVIAKFNFTNNTPNPIIINNVVATCGCMKVSFDKKPIISGASSSIIIHFNPNNQSGNIHKNVYVYTSSSKTVAAKKLSIIGFVDNSMNKWSGYKCLIGTEVRSRTNEIVFQKLNRGEKVIERIEFVNVSDRSVTLSVLKWELPEYISFKSEPSSVPAGCVGEMIITFDSSKFPKKMLASSEESLVLEGVTGKYSQRSITIKINLSN